MKHPPLSFHPFSGEPFLLDQLERDPYNVIPHASSFRRRKEASYNLRDIPIGNDRMEILNGRPAFTGQDVCLDFRRSLRGVVCSMSGSGKTIFTERLMALLHHSGGIHVAVMADPKGEAYSCRNPVQPRLRPFLHKDDVLLGAPTRSYMPVFMQKIAQLTRKPTGLEGYCQLSMRDLTEKDLVTLSGLGRLKDAKAKNTFIRIANDMPQHTRTIQAILKRLDDEEDVPTNTKNSIYNALFNVEAREVIGQKAPVSFVDVMNAGGIPVLDLRYFKMCDDNYLQAEVAVRLREIYLARQEGILKKPALALIPENVMWCPKLYNPTSKEEIMNIYDFGRKPGLGVISDGQHFSGKIAMDPGVLNRSDFIWVNYMTTKKDLETISDSVELSLRDRSILENLVGSRGMQTGQWAQIERESKEITVFYPYASICAHAEEQLAS